MMTVRPRVKTKLVQGCKMQFHQSANFFVKMILMIGMHSFFNMQMKSFKTWKKMIL